MTDKSPPVDLATLKPVLPVGTQDAVAPTRRRRLRGAVRPLSPLQEGMYFHHAHVRNTVYLEQLTCEIRGPLDLDIARGCLEALVREHEILRTVFVMKKPAGLRQIVLPFVRLDLEVIDIADEADCDGYIEGLLDREAALNLDLSKSASRCKLLRLGPERWVFLWTYHHIIMDSWTLLMLQKQFTKLYSEALNPETATAEGVSVNPGQSEKPTPQYRDYVDWAQSCDREKTVAFWRRYLGRAASSRPVVLPSESVDAHTVNTKTDLPPAFLDLLTSIQQRHKVTATSVFLAAWCVYSLYRYKRDEDIVACVYANRLLPLKSAGKIAGLFVNSLPLRTSRRMTPSEQIAAIHRHMLQWPGQGWIALSDIMAAGGMSANDITSFVNISIDQPDIVNEYTDDLPINIDRIRYREQAHFAVCLDVFLTGAAPSLAVRHDVRMESYDAAELRQVLERILRLFQDQPDVSQGELVAALKKPRLLADANFDF